MQKSILIIGGGIAGLATAYELSKHNVQVTLLEAKNRLGGRIHTFYDISFSQPVELGAEFIHGDLPHTLSILNEAAISYNKINDTMFHLEKGAFKKQKSFTKDWDKVMKQMSALTHDMPLDVFIDTFFGDDKYADLRASIKGFAGGFDLADTATASSKSLYREWSNEMENQYRINGGYKVLIDYLATQCKNNGSIIQNNCCAKKISWHKNEVHVLTMCSRFFKADKAVIAVPVSVLQASNKDENYLEFEPAILQHINAAKDIGFGDVIKIILEFDNNFWNAKNENAGFFLTDEIIPTWWSQLPIKNAVLTGWVGGEKASSLKLNTDEEILKITLQSLASAFDVSFDTIKSKLKAGKIANWCKEADINGGYSFNMVKSVDAKKVLRKPVEDTLFFSGEALFEGTPVGTVEAALASGKHTALQVLDTL